MSRKTTWLVVAIIVAFLFVVGTISTLSTPAPKAAETTATPSQSTPTYQELPPPASSASTPPADNSASVFIDMLSELPSDDSPGSHSGYSRDFFRAWIDADKDGCDTRAEVLMIESRIATTYRGTCTIETGEWTSDYDGQIFTDASGLDIDHFVPLKEAWISGAYGWDASTRVSYGNDLGYALSLLAVSAHSNRSKSDQDPANWLPAVQDYVCNYSANWVAVKWRWNLSVDALERTTLNTLLSGCSSISIALPERALIIMGSPQQAPPVPPSDGVLDPNFGTCAAAHAAGKGPYIQGVDPEYDWYRDRDKDGMVCE